MRPKLAVGGLAGLLALALPVLGQLPLPAPPTQPVPLSTAVPEFATIVVAEVEIRSGGSAKFYPTSKLRQGERVQVVRESTEFPGYLAIKPPRDSFSWINGNFVTETKIQGMGVVICAEDAEVPVLAGSTLNNQPPNVTSANVKRGTILTIIGQANKTQDGGVWVPIAPVPTEVRFVPTAAVQRNTTSIQAAFTPQAPNPASMASQGGTPADLERQYLQKAYDTATDPALKDYFRSKLLSLPAPTNLQAVSVTPRPPVSLTPATGLQAPSNLVPLSNAPASAAPDWSPYGILRRTSFQKDGMPMYVLEDTRGRPILYVTTQPGMAQLDGYVGRTVSLYGAMTYHSDAYMRNNVMVATHVAVP